MDKTDEIGIRAVLVTQVLVHNSQERSAGADTTQVFTKAVKIACSAELRLSKKAFLRGHAVTFRFVLILTALAGGGLPPSLSGPSPLRSRSSLG